MKRQGLSSLILLLITLAACAFTYLIYDFPRADAAERLISRDVCMQLDKVHGSLERIRISGWTEINGHYPVNVLTEKAKELLPVLGEGRKFQISSGETTDYCQVKLSAGDNGAEYSLILYSSIPADELTGEHSTYIIAEAILDSDSLDREEAVYETLKELLSQFDAAPSLNTTYIAAIPGRLEGWEMEQTGRQILEGFNGRIVEMSRDSEWISLTGYSSRIDGGLHSDNGIFNMNVALRYNSHEGKTYLWLGTPVISVSY